MKQAIISELAAKLAAMGIPAELNRGADITVHTEFLDAGWSTGSKKVSYEASILADENQQTVFMYEKTTEVGHGLSFGGESGSSFQSGKTLFRKVKSIQYGPDGKAYEYTLDLGAIPKAAKETAKANGWGFKTVLSKPKAMYPAGTAPAPAPLAAQAPPQAFTPSAAPAGGYCGNCGMPMNAGSQFCGKCGKPAAAAAPPAAPLTPNSAAPAGAPAPYSDPQGSFYVGASAPPARGKGSRAGVIGLIAFILLGAALLFVLVAAKATPVGWAVCLGLFAVAFFIQRKLRQRGCLLQALLWVITGFLLIFPLTLFSEGEFSLTTASIQNAQMTTAVDSTGKPVDSLSAYLPDAPELVAVAELRHAPPSTQVKFVWTYVTSDILITEFVMDNGDNGSDIYVFSHLTNDAPWPEGDYRVDIYVANREKPDATVQFSVSA